MGLPENPEHEVIRVRYLGKDLDSQLRALRLGVNVIPIIVPLGNYLFDLAVAKEELEQFDASPKPVLTTSDEKTISNDLIRLERFTTNDPMVRLYGKAQAVRMTLQKFQNHLPICRDGVKLWLEGQIKSLQALLQSQGWDQVLSPDICQRLDPEYVSFHNKCLGDSPMQELEGDLPRLRLQPPWFAAGDLPPVEVGKIEEVLIEQGRIEIKVFLPKQSLQGEKRPGMEWFHGGEDSIWLQADSADCA